MRKKQLSKKGWNNVLMLAVIVAMIFLQLPEYLKQRRADNNLESSTILLTLLPTKVKVTSLKTPQYTLSSTALEWQANKPLLIGANQLIQRWQKLSGTPVTAEIFAKLNLQVQTKQTIEVICEQPDKTFNLSYYKTPKFWLFQNWQGDWFAVSVNSDYFYPLKK